MRASARIIAVVNCRSCEVVERRTFLSEDDFHKDISAQNDLCTRCFVETNYVPGTLIARENLPVYKVENLTVGRKADDCDPSEFLQVNSAPFAAGEN